MPTMGSVSPTLTATPSIAIIGAGLTGLLAAHGLKKNGFPNVTIYEREPSLTARSRDWTIVLHWAMPTFLDLLPEHVRQNISHAYCNPHVYRDDYDDEQTREYVESLMVYNAVSGERLFSSKMPGSRRVSRQKLRGVLVEGLEEGCIQWGREVVAVETGDGDGPVRLRMGDGEVAEADYVLGADSPGSKIRELLFRDQGREKESKLVNSGFMISSCLVQYGNAEKVEKLVGAHPVAAIAMGEDVLVAVGVTNADDPEDKSTWTCSWHKIWRGSLSTLPVPRQGQETLDYLLQTTTGHPEPFQSLIDWTPEGSPCYIDEMKYWVPVPFDSHGGRVTLAGDAAHPMLVYRGQGFQHAVLDVRNYVDALVKIRDVGEDKKKVMAAYDAEMTARGAEAVKQSVREAELSMSLESTGKMLMASKGHGRLA